MWNNFGGLPKLPSISGSKTRISEMASRVVASTGTTGGFRGTAIGLPSLADASRTVLQTASRVAGAVGSTIEQAIGTLGNITSLPSSIFNPMSSLSALQRRESANPSVSASQTRAASRTDNTVSDDHKVKLLQKDSGQIVAAVIFDVMPEVFESRSAEYEAVQPPQAPGAFQKYKGTSSTQWTVNATFICRTTEEATRNLIYLNQLRSWVMPYFGVRTRQQNQNKTGAPPPVLEFSGWRKGMVGPVPVVITSLQWTFPRDVDYIPARELTDSGNINIPFPTVLTVSISLIESFSAEQLNGFNRNRFELGDFENAYRPLVRQPSAVSPGIPVQAAQQLAQPARTFSNSRFDAGRAVPKSVSQSAAETARLAKSETAVAISQVTPVAASTYKYGINLEEPLTNRTGGYFGGAITDSDVGQTRLSNSAKTNPIISGGGSS